MSLPEPALVIPATENGIIGAKLIKPLDVGYYERGYNVHHQDEYEPMFLYRDGKEVAARWEFRRRIRQFLKPLHINHDGTPYRCEECERWWKLYPDKDGTEEVLIEDSSRDYGRD